MAVDKFKPLSTALIGSMPRNEKVLKARRMVRAGMIEKEDYMNLVEEQTKEIIEMQEDLGIDIITSGEIARDNYVSFISEKLGGVIEMTQADMLEYIEDKREFENQLSILDVPAQSIKNAICNDKLVYKGDIVKNELLMVKKYTDKPIKITMPGPYLVTRSMWLYELSKNGYPSKEALGEAVIDIFEKEILEIQKIGVDVIQLDEPVLTEIVFTEGKPRSFMCASLSQRKDPTEELEFATHLISSVISKIDKKLSISALHVCRGNWSKKEEILLEGPYTPLVELFSKSGCDNLSLEFSTPRAGELKALLADDRINSDIILGLGVLNPRMDEAESVEGIVERAREALKYVKKENLWLNPDCGYATFSNRPVNTYGNIENKIKNMVTAARILRDEC